jgi:hypothetical protein
MALVFTTISYSTADSGSNIGDSSVSPGAVSNDGITSPDVIDGEPISSTPDAVDVESGESSDDSIITNPPDVNTSEDKDDGFIIPLATSEHFINIPQFDGAYPISGEVGSASTTDSTRATFSDGKILGHMQCIHQYLM